MKYLSNEKDDQLMDKSIAAVDKKFSNRPFTRSEYDKFRDALPTHTVYGRWGRRHERSVQPTLQTLVDANIVLIVDVEEFKKYYIEDGWNEKKWIAAWEYEEIKDLLYRASSSTLSNMLESELNDKIESFECKRYFYKLNYHNLGDYIRAEMPWITKLLIDGVF